MREEERLREKEHTEYTSSEKILQRVGQGRMEEIGREI